MSEQREGAAVRLGPERVSVAAALVFFLGALPVAGSAMVLLPLLLVPVACVVWVVRARVVAGDDGVEVCNGLGVRRFAWPQVSAFQVPRHGPVRLVPVRGRPVLLTAMSRRDLPRVLAVSPHAAA